MKAANAHRIAYTAHHEAGLLANALGHPGTTRYHVEQKTRVPCVSIARDSIKPTYPTQHIADEGIRHAHASANDARRSNQIAHHSIHTVARGRYSVLRNLCETELLFFQNPAP